MRACVRRFCRLDAVAVVSFVVDMMIVVAVAVVSFVVAVVVDTA